MAFSVTFFSTIPYNDPKYRSIFIKIGGSLLVESDNPNYLVPGSEQTVKYVADMANYSVAKVLFDMKPTVMYRELSSNLGLFVNQIAGDLKSRQITLVGASFEPIAPDDASMARIKRQDETESLMNDPSAMAAKMAEAQAAAEKTMAAAPAATPAATPAPAAATPAPAAATPAPAAATPAPAAATPAPASNEPVLMKFCSRCGTPSTGSKFCTTCGASMIRRT